MILRVTGGAVLVVALFTLTLDAQGTKKAVKKDEVGSIEVYKTEAGKFRFRIKNDEGKTIAMPLPQMHWETKKDALKAIEELKSILDTAKPVDHKDDETKEKKVEKKPATP